MKYVFLTILCLGLYAVLGFSLLSAMALSLWGYYLIEFFEQSNDRIAFKEYLMVIYGVNYLFSPALSYLIEQDGVYRMKLPEEEFFILAIPAMFLLQLGLNCIKTNIFTFQFNTLRLQSVLNQAMLVQWFYMGLLFRFLNPIMPSDLAFLFYLLSGIRFVAAYGLFLVDRRRYKYHLYFILFLELAIALKDGMFHDFVMWLIFFAIFWMYIMKPSRNLKIVMALGGLMFIYIIQVTKADYRAQIGQSGTEAGLRTFENAVSKSLQSEEGIFTSSNTTGSLSRANQAWIFASTANRMNHFQDYQGVELISKYAEAAFLPRFLAPDKLRAGDKTIFNRFSGHRVNPGTSMGLGFFADGYIAYGPMGTYLFAFVLGLIFCLVFKITEHWSKISPFFVLLIFPILHYAVRPDCETQTIMGHIVKGLFVFAGVAWYYSVNFSRKISDVKRNEELERWWKTKANKSVRQKMVG